MRSKGLEAFHQRVVQYDKDLAPPLGRALFHGKVLVVSDDGSVFLYKNAFIVVSSPESSTRYVGVIAEHHDIQCWSMDDLWHFHADLVRQLEVT